MKSYLINIQRVNETEGGGPYETTSAKIHAENWATALIATVQMTSAPQLGEVVGVSVREVEE